MEEVGEEPRPPMRSRTQEEAGAAALGREEEVAEAGWCPGNPGEEAAEGRRSSLEEEGAGSRSWRWVVEVGGSPEGPLRPRRGAGAEVAAAGGPREPVGGQRRVWENLWPSGGEEEEGTPSQEVEEEGGPSEEEEEEEGGTPGKEQSGISRGIMGNVGHDDNHLWSSSWWRFGNVTVGRTLRPRCRKKRA